MIIEDICGIHIDFIEAESSSDLVNCFSELWILSRLLPVFQIGSVPCQNHTYVNYIVPCNTALNTGTMYRPRREYYSHYMGYIVPLVTRVVLRVHCTVHHQMATRREAVTYISQPTTPCHGNESTDPFLPWLIC